MQVSEFLLFFKCHRDLINIIKQQLDISVTLSSPKLTLKWLGHFFQNVISLSDAVHLVCNIFYMKLVQYNECLVSIVDTDGLVL